MMRSCKDLFWQNCLLCDVVIGSDNTHKTGVNTAFAHCNIDTPAYDLLMQNQNKPNF